MIPLLNFVFQATMQCANEHASNPALLKVLFSSLILIAKIFYSLNFQVSLDRPDFKSIVVNTLSIPCLSVPEYKGKFVKVIIIIDSDKGHLKGDVLDACVFLIH